VYVRVVFSLDKMLSKYPMGWNCRCLSQSLSVEDDAFVLEPEQPCLGILEAFRHAQTCASMSNSHDLWKKAFIGGAIGVYFDAYLSNSRGAAIGLRAAVRTVDGRSPSSRRVNSRPHGS